jgi:hypothetical protein
MSSLSLQIVQSHVPGHHCTKRNFITYLISTDGESCNHTRQLFRICNEVHYLSVAELKEKCDCVHTVNVRNKCDISVLSGRPRMCEKKPPFIGTQVNKPPLIKGLNGECREFLVVVRVLRMWEDLMAESPTKFCVEISPSTKMRTF